MRARAASGGFSVPTWTGKSGAAGRTIESGSTVSIGALARAIREKLLSSGGASSSEALVAAFSHTEPTAFKAALKSVAEKRKRGDGKTEWKVLFNK